MSFVTGRLWDDENGVDTVGAFTTADFTEVEWVLVLQTPAADSEIYEFRVYDGSTPLATYTDTPQLTVTDVSTAAIPTAILRLGGVAPAAIGTGEAVGNPPVATLRLTGTTVGAGTGSVASIPTATLIIGPRPVSAGGAGAAVALVPPASLRLTPVTPVGAAGVIAAIPPAILRLVGGVVGTGLMVAILTCRVTGPALRRLVTGPALEPVSVTGPSNEPAEQATGPALSRTPDGPALITRMTDGPGVESLNVVGPDLSRDVTGPAVDEQYVLTGPGVCDGN